MNLKELSQKLGLSQTTVSRALNGYPEVSNATRQRVEEAALRYQYHPNARAKRLATGRSFTIGHVIPISKKNEVVNPIFADFIAAAGEVYARSGYDLMLSVVADEDQEQFFRDLTNRGTVDGVILHAPKIRDGRISLLQSIGLPFVVHGRVGNSESDYNWLDVNNLGAFYRATSLLLDLGHRGIALINGAEDMEFALRRRQGYEQALSDRGVSLAPELVSHDEMTETYGHAVAQRMLTLPEPPTAFVVSSVIPAIGVRRAVEEAGLILGREVSLVVHDDELSYFRNDADVPIFTAVRSPVREAGRKCAEMLLKAIEYPERPPRHALLEADLMLGRSTGPAPASRRAREEG